MKLNLTEKKMSEYTTKCINTKGKVQDFLVDLGAVTKLLEATQTVYKYKLDNDNWHRDEFIYFAHMRKMSVCAYVFVKFIQTYFENQEHETLQYYRYFNDFYSLSAYCKFENTPKTIKVVDNMVKYGYVDYVDFNFEIDDAVKVRPPILEFKRDFDRDMAIMLIESRIIKSTICGGVDNIYMLGGHKIIISSPLVAVSVMLLVYRAVMFYHGITDTPTKYDDKFYKNFDSVFESSELFTYASEYFNIYTLREVVKSLQSRFEVDKK